MLPLFERRNNKLGELLPELYHAYCQAGVRSAFTHLVLTALGHPDVRTYDGSWEEWGNDPSVPMVTGRL